MQPLYIIHSTPSTKNKEGKRNPEMHQTMKGNQWYHGMKVHAGADVGTGYVHTITGTAANVHDIAETSKLLREDDEICYGDSGYIGVEKRPEIKYDEHLSNVTFWICRRPSKLNVSKDYQGIDWERDIEHRKASVRCKVEHVFLIGELQLAIAIRA